LPPDQVAKRAVSIEKQFFRFLDNGLYSIKSKARPLEQAQPSIRVVLKAERDKKAWLLKARRLQERSSVG
jgi:hypothetical protein